MTDTSVAQMEELLRRMMQNNTEVVRGAVTILNKLLKQSQSMLLLMELLFKNPHHEIRQLSAVLMRKKIVGHWGKLAADVQANCKKALLNSLINDPSPQVRMGIAAVIGVLARACLPTGEWPELLEFLFQCTQSTNVDHREIAMGLFDTLTESIGDYLRPHFQSLQKLFMQGLKEKEPKVKISSLKAVGSLVGWISNDKDVALFHELLPAIGEAVVYCLNNNMEDEASHAFEIFDNLIELPNAAVNTCIPDIINFVLQVGAKTDLDIDVRHRALTCIEWVLSFKKKIISKNKFVVPILQVVFPMCAEPEDDTSTVEERSSHKFAAQLIDMMANAVHFKHFFTPAMEFVTRFAQSTNPNERKAAAIALAVMSEGCSEPMRNDNTLKQCLNFLFSTLRDPEVEVREAGCIALGQFSKYLQPEIIQHYQSVLPNLFQALNDPTSKVRMGSCYAIEAFCENLGEEILPFVEPLLSKLIEMLRSGERDVQEIALSAISSTCAAAGKAVAPFYSTLLPMLSQMMTITSEDDIILRCRATECIGLLAGAVGKEQFQPALKEFMHAALQGLTLEYNELREYTYGFFCNIAELTKADFTEFLPIVLPFVLASCDSTDGITGYQNSQDQIEGLDEDENNEALNLHIRTAFLDEKTAACHAVGVFAESVGAAFVPYIDRIIKSFNELQAFFHEEVRQQMLISMKQMALCVHAAHPLPKPWEKGVPEKDQPLAGPTRAFVDHLWAIYMNTLQIDDDKQIVGTVCECISQLVKVIGPACVEKHLPQTIPLVCSILERKAACQIIDEFDNEDEDELQLIDVACDCLIDLAKVCGPLLEPYFTGITQILVQYQQDMENPGNRSIAVGVLAEVSNALGYAVVPYLEKLVAFAIHGMKDSNNEVRSNSAFFIGILMQHGSITAYPYYNQVLQALATLFNEGENTLPNLLDNSCGAVARMIVAAPSVMPLPQVLPVFLKFLPLRKDFQENATVYNCLFELIKSTNPAVATHLPQIVSVFARALATSDVAVEIKVTMVNLLKSLIQSNGTQMEQIIKSLPANEQQILQQSLSQQ